MLFRRRVRRPLYLAPIFSAKARRIIIFLIVAGVLISFFAEASLYLRELTCEMALSDATDNTTVCINNTIASRLADHDYGYDYFVKLECNNEGDVAAVVTNMTRINALSAEILQDVIKTSSNGALNMNVPLGNLLGSTLLLGRGPSVPIEVTMLTSSHIDLKNELVSAGINQTKHQIKLDVVVDIDVVLPWKTVSTQIVSEVLVAETVIVGKVPNSYFDME